MEKQKDTSQTKTPWFEIALPICAIIIVILIWYSSYKLITQKAFSPADSTAWAMRGQFGDLFGAVNSLFSGLAFAGIIFTIFLQRQELKSQRKELELTRNEFERQNTTLSRQRFENTFFSMLTIHIGIVASLEFKNEKGARAFEPMMKLFSSKIQPNWMTYDSSKGMFSEYRGYFQNSWPDSLKYFSQYLQSLVAMYNAITDYSEQKEPRQRYFNILRSYLSDHEKLFLFYYILFASDFSSTNKGLQNLEKDMNLLADTYFPRLDNSHKEFLTDPNRRTITN